MLIQARPILAAMIAILFATALAAVDAGQSVPRFTATTMDGKRFTNETLKGNVVLLQFWTTWCGVCRGDQPVLDDIAEEFAGRGLVILAVNVGESKRTVKRYLDERPRSCKVVLTEDTNLAALFPARGVPSYVLIDRDGKIITSQTGGGEHSVRNMVDRAFPAPPEPIEAAPAAAQPEGDLERPRIERRAAPVSTIVEVTAPPEPRTTVTGVLNRFDCLGAVARIHVVAGPKTHVLLIRQPDRVVIGGGGTRTLACGPQKTPATVHFVPATDDKYGTSGDVRAIDFPNTR